MNVGKFILGLIVVFGAWKLGNWGWDEWQLSQPGFHETSCWFSKQVTGDVRCGYMVVPENRSVAKSRTIRLPVLIFAAEPTRRSRTEENTPKEPILYLTGGPGGQAYLGEQLHVDSWWYERRLFPRGHDLIVLGQRGTGLKEPDFDCDELRDEDVVLAGYTGASSSSDRRERQIEAAIACAERLTSDGVDLTAYNSRESALDVAELRNALGIEEWTLFGISYGTRIALSVLRDHPEGVRAVILDSVLPPEANALIDDADFFRIALQRFLQDCDTVLPCEFDPEGPMGDYLRARDRLAAKPVEIDLRRLDPDSDEKLSIDERLFDRLLFKALYVRESRSYIPPMIRDAGDQRAEGTQKLIQKTAKFSSSVSKAVYLSHICHDEIAFETAESIASAAAAAGTWGHMIAEASDAYLCDVWPAGSADPIENERVLSGVPALLLAGAVDPVTPPVLARSAAEGLENAFLLEFRNTGHGIIYEIPCISDILTEFLADPRREPTAQCRMTAFLAAEPKPQENRAAEGRN